MLTQLIFLPLVGALLVALIPRGRPDTVRWLGLLVSLAAAVLAARVVGAFDASSGGLQLVERAAWIPGLGVGYAVGVDGISLLLVGLVAVIFPVALLGSWGSITERVKAYTIAMLGLQTAVLGTFLSLDLVLFYVFWEAVLIPMAFLIGVWGGPNRRYAAIKFFLYTMAASVLMLVAILVLHALAAGQLGERTFDLQRLAEVRLDAGVQGWLFAAFALAFAVKVPVWPLHTWLPDAHTEAPTAGSVILAAVLLKMGTYGFVRFGPMLFPEALVAAAPLLAALAIVGIVYGAAVSWAQTDFKRLIAFSSVSHLGFVMLGIAALNEQGFQGSLLQMVNHGISTGALFMIVGVLYDRTHTRELADYGGVAARMPRFAALFTIVLLSSAALPGTNGFVGEFLILLGAFRVSAWWAALGVLGVILSAVYLLWAYQQVMHGPATARHPERLTEITPRELLAFAPLVALIFAIGLYPRPLLDRSEAAVRAALDRLERPAQQRIVPQAREPR
ncbi:MAG: NADH-quinone oxidoreductase subunit M [Armatimonadota bacterium]|nr:NADH-quinone oxidoreductase subunit M [Armatimonadota bacterium]MDR7423287.1 NADH-quinone oxidoreductase subunit M [Armatimonadota bacterium]MDR7455018.1 NADH-quinone oxidoreductase subunit M [Armatimonadota bacterium]MDR7456568.1 NADH-quinone oxidoreductase subunit M [Armatimonadota bacterium]MDR7497355.1 NADH-quinone oxidoreductase subunit M [Armatimonadota bacterium]